MRSVFSSRFALGGLLIATLVIGGCGPSPAMADKAPSGTLVVVIRQGPERVPFNPKEVRIQRANQQLASVLGHSIQIELDGALLPQTKEGAEDLIASLVEDVVRDLAELAKHEKSTLAFAREHFEHLVIRYAPSEAAAREDRSGWHRSPTGAKLDVASKTIDVVRAEATWRALERGAINTVLYRAAAAKDDATYAQVLPDTIPRGARRAWFDYHAHGRGTRDDTIGSVHALTVRGMVMLNGLAKSDGDAELTRDTRKWLVDAVDAFSATYHHHAAEVEAASASSSYRKAESAYVEWLRAELPQMTLDERGTIATHLWVIDFRKNNGGGSGDRDRFAKYAFPGLDPMAFSFQAVDAWIAAGHPARSPSTSEPHLYFDHVVCPAVTDTKGGEVRFSNPGRCDGQFYQWALVDRDREETFTKGVLARNDVPFATAVFYNARRTLRDEPSYLRFLRRFERTPALWKVGADVMREAVYRPSPAVLEESRRLWRELPTAKPYVLLWFGRHVENSYHPDSDWPDLVQGSPADEATLAGLLALGSDGFKILHAAWPGVAKSGGRVRVVAARARTLLDGNDTAQAGQVTHALADLARVLCDEGSMSELAELRTFARSELASRPGAGLSTVVEAADPAECRPKRKPPPVRTPSAGKTEKPHAPTRSGFEKDPRQ